MKSVKVWLTLLFSIVFLGMFYRQLLGLNLLVFEVLLIGTSMLLNKPKCHNVHAYIVLAGTLLSAIFVLLYGSVIARAINIFSFFLFLGYRCNIQLRSPLYSLLLATIHLVEIPGIIISNFLMKWGLTQRTLERMKFHAKIIFLPICILILFILIYAYSNIRFSNLLANAWVSCLLFYDFVMKHFNFTIFFVLVLGLLIAASYLFHAENKWITEIDAHSEDRLVRRKMRRNNTNFKTMDLKKEYKAMLFLLVTLNLLIAVINIIDIDWIWINFSWKGSENGSELKQFVHNGTYLLILAIILSIVIAMYIFRNSINFYTRNKWIKLFTYVWLLQNVIMVISVALRTYRYVEYFNLAHKRIGLLFFLLALLVLIITLLVKIRHVKSDYFLLRSTALGSYIILFFVCTVNWDIMIARYNFKHAGTALLHKDWMMTLSDKTLPILRENIGILDDSIHINSWHYGRYSTYNDMLEKREKLFMTEYKKRGRFSWNYTDYYAYRTLEKQMEIRRIKEQHFNMILSRP